ncbi:hypothetical protein [Gordonia soli]|uniref:Uncharacterized protein n=1 Tax=Gordonia soli NBRC 108243 TaxID=1223545 RepID=M0QQX6_9ACTN|nr:hypothetical protein [Gordonia soli]GAC71080.1 hypothetical protein GS4_51_00180 [Gordonia soli NBRC 108243]
MTEFDTMIFRPSGADIRRHPCGARVFYAEPVAGGRLRASNHHIPVDVDPVPNGKFAVYPRPGKSPTVQHISAPKAVGMKAAGIPLYQLHMPECPKRDQIRAAARRKATR